MDQKAEKKIKSILTETAQKNNVTLNEVKQSVSETWKYICKNENPNIRKFGLALLENGKPPAPEKITLYLTMLARLCNSTPIADEPDAEKRLAMAIEHILQIYRPETK